MRNSLLILALSLTCCGAPDEPAAEECGMVFSPQDLLLDATRGAVERWSHAMGCEHVIGEGGVAVELTLSVQKPDGTQGPGITTDDLSKILIHQRTGSAQRTDTVAHEFCHIFGVGAEHVDTSGICSGSKGHAYDIDSASLAAVCERVPCGDFRPEVP